MKIKSYIIFLFLFYSFSAVPQNNVSIEWGAIQKSSQKITSGFIGGDNKVFYTLKRNELNGNSWIEKYDSNANLIYSQIINIKKGELKRLFYINNKLVLFAQYNEKKERKSHLYRYEVDEEGNVEDEAILVSKFSYPDKKKVI